MRRHRGDRPFICQFEFCRKAFAELWALKKHTRLHTGEKPYICSFCPKSFSDCSNLTKHKKTHEKNTTNDARMQPKNQVWNILDEGASQAVGSTMAASSPISNTNMLPSQEADPTSQIDDSDNVQQIIYISYTTDEKDAIDDTSQKGILQNDNGLVTMAENTPEEEVLSQLSTVVEPNLQQNVINITPSSSLVSVSQDQWHLPHTAASSRVEDPTTATVPIDSTSAVSGNGLENSSEEGGIYVDVRLSDNDDVPIRLRVPPNFDPIAYATEYIQLQTTAAQAESLLTDEALQMQTQNIENSVNNVQEAQSKDQVTVPEGHSPM